jgi:hypothetical protein
LLLVAGTAVGAQSRRHDFPWKSLGLRGFALRPSFVAEAGSPLPDVVDTSVARFYNVNRTVTLVWDRDSLAEASPDFGGYSVYRSVGPDMSQATLLRRYIKNPAASFGPGGVDPATGSSSWLWTFRREVGVRNVGLFIDPDSIYSFDRTLKAFVPAGQQEPVIDTVYSRIVLAGPKDGFEYYYSVTICDTTLSGEDLTPRDANKVGPIQPTGRAIANDLDLIRVVPNPYTFKADWDFPGRRKIRFTNLPARATIEIYTAAAELVRVLDHSNTLDSGQDWDTKNGKGTEVGAGIYIYRVFTPDGHEKSGRFTIIR